MEDFNSNFTVKELRELCVKFNLPAYGLKAEVIQRILDHLQFIIDRSCQPNSNANEMPISRNTFFKAIFKKIIPHRSESSSVDSAFMPMDREIVSIYTRFKIVVSQIIERVPTVLNTFVGVYAMYTLYSAIFGVQRFEAVITNRFWRYKSAKLINGIKKNDEILFQMNIVTWLCKKK